MSTFTKDPDATLDYTVDWEPFLAGDLIDTALWIIPTGVVSEAESSDSTTATVWLSGGTLGAAYDVICRITTVGGRIDDRTIRVIINDK